MSGVLSSNWAINKARRVSTYWGNPLHPNQIDKDGISYKTGVYIHRSNNSGYAGGHVSEGCLLIAPKDWPSFNNQLSGVSQFHLKVSRTGWHIPMKLPQKANY